MLVAYFFSKKIIFHRSTSEIQLVVHLIIQPVVYYVNGMTAMHWAYTMDTHSCKEKKRAEIKQFQPAGSQYVVLMVKFHCVEFVLGPLAVIQKIVGLTLALDFFDRCAINQLAMGKPNLTDFR